MITKVIMPQLSLTMRTGIVLEWYKNVGEFVNEGEPLCSIEGDKATIDIEAPTSGYLKKILAEEDQEFPVKQAMAFIGEKEDQVPTDESAVSATEEIKEKQTIKLPPKSPPDNTRVKASPVAKRLAKEFGIDLASINGTGPDGMVSKEDVLAVKEKVVNQQVEKTDVEKITPAGIKKIVAERMRQSYLDAPHIHLSVARDVTVLLAKRKEVNENSADVHISVTDLLLYAVSRALEKHPLMNATFKNEEILLFKKINIGFAAATDKGLVVPVIKDTNEKNLRKISGERQVLAKRAQAGNQTAHDLSDGTFTITNLGMYGIESFDPIIAPGQSAILAVGTAKKDLAFDEKGEVVEKQLLGLTLACDHRVADGMDGAMFLADLKEILENAEEVFSSIL